MAGVPDFKKVANTNEETSKLQERLQEFFTPIQKCPLIDGVLLTNISLVSSGTNSVAHKLNRAPLGWLVVRNRSNSIIWDTQDTNSLKTKSLSLQASSNTVVDLWVF